MPRKRRPKRNPAVPLFRKAPDANHILRIHQCSGMNYKDFRRISEHHRPYSWVREPGGRHFHRKITVIKII
jgi:hypothetical protein